MMNINKWFDENKLTDVEKAERILQGYCPECIHHQLGKCLKCIMSNVQPITPPTGKIFKLKMINHKERDAE